MVPTAIHQGEVLTDTHHEATEAAEAHFEAVCRLPNFTNLGGESAS